MRALGTRSYYVPMRALGARPYHVPLGHAPITFARAPGQTTVRASSYVCAPACTQSPILHGQFQHWRHSAPILPFPRGYSHTRVILHVPRARAVWLYPLLRALAVWLYPLPSRAVVFTRARSCVQ